MVYCASVPPSMSNKPVTIQDVALLAQTSPSTVSNLLNGRVDRMRPDTRERIERAMDQLGYQPSQVARQLRTGQAPILGLIIPSVANPFWGSFAQFVEESARAQGYQVLLCNGGRDPGHEQRYAESLWSHGVRGVIFGSSPLSLDHVLGFVERGLRVVVFDRDMRDVDRSKRDAIDNISIDNEMAGRLATEHLLGLGHRNIGFLSGPLRTASRLARLEGYRRALREAGVEPDARLVWEEAGNQHFGDVEGFELGRCGARELLGGVAPPSALFTINDMYALGAYAGVRDLGLRVPEDVSIVGFDDISMAEIAHPPLTTIRHPVREMMQTAVALLVGRLQGTYAEPAEHVTVVPELVVRASTAPR
jgi:DNA-binding LacI/PurR family transcriptional regulator